jgi:hypothetical protein
LPLEKIKMPIKREYMFSIRWSYVWLLLAFVGCRKDVDDFQIYAPSATELGALLSDRVPSSASVSTFNLSNLSSDKVLETSSGVQVFLVDTDQLFGKQGSGIPVPCSTCPDLKIEVTEVIDKGDIVARGLHTIGDSNKVFETAGVIRIKANCSGQALELLPNRTLKVNLPKPNTTDDFWVFDRDTEDNKPWSITPRPVYEAEWPSANGSTQYGYELVLSQLGWAAAGKFIPDQTSSFCLQMPTGFGDQNTLTYVVFKDQQVVLPLTFDLGKNLFCYPKMPVGYQVQTIAVSKLGDQFYLGKAQTEVGTNAVFPMNTQVMTEEAVINFVKSL